MTTTTTTTDLDTLAVNTIRGLCMDAVQKANSGHPGTPMGIAPVAYTLWQRFLQFDPADPIWPNRDRFVLSEGHASTLLWSLLHLTGVHAVDPDYEVLGTWAVTMDDLKTFRQLGSHCPGHPEYRWTSGVEATTGPLGQGVADSVGMAIAGQWLAARYNRDEFGLFDFNVYALVAVEQASTLGWDRYVGPGGAVVGMHTFGASAPLKQLLTKFGFTPEQVAHVARERVAAARDRRA